MALPYSLTEPAGVALPLVVDSPHSGLVHAETLPLAAPPEALLTGWDAYVDQLFAHAPMVGGTLLCAGFPRWMVDVNRARDDIDPALIDGAMPYAVQPSDKSGRGMGVLRRLAPPGVPVYAAPLSPDMAEYRRPTTIPTTPRCPACWRCTMRVRARCGTSTAIR